jgi:primosomal protein N' (replication factor Y) (superfamily II helicase)
MQYAEIILPLNFGGTFTYGIPLELQGLLQAGVRVEVPLGNNKIYAGIVLNIHNNKPDAYAVKPIKTIIDDAPIVQQKHLAFWQWISTYYCCNLGEVMNAVLPAYMKLSSETALVLNELFEPDATPLTDDEYMIVEALQIKPELTLQEAQKIVNKNNCRKIIMSLIEKRAIYVFENVKESYKPKLEKIVILNPALDNEDSLKNIFNTLEKSPKQLHVVLSYLHLINTKKNVLQKELLAAAQATSAQLQALVKQNIFAITTQKIDRIQFKASTIYEAFELNAMQHTALQTIKNAFAKNKVCLLHGITGSGKTNVHIKLIESILAQQKQVLYLVPEIALTAQVINKLYSFFGEVLGVYHSKFSNNERIETWQNLSTGKIKILLGARSSLFLPFQNLGLIIVDEEHDMSYKQADVSPRYHARDAAIVLAHQFNANIVLSTATPSVESYNNAVHHKYELVQMLQRFNDIQLPDIDVVDARAKPGDQRVSPLLTNVLIDEINATIKQKQQVILFQNRRGFAPYLYCASCGWHAVCKHCDVSITYHKTTDKLHCHYCGTKWNLYKQCPSCNDNKMYFKNYGTERVEEEVRRVFPNAVIDRLDTDTARTKNKYQNIIKNVEKNYTQILIGTQLVVKGLDFDNVQLVGVLSTDSLFTMPDFRVNERAFQMLSQVSGRAGRKQNKSKVLLQTINTANPYLPMVQNNDYKTFFDLEITYRKEFWYPPYIRLIKLVVKHKEQDKLIAAAQQLAELIATIPNTQMIGPSEPMVPRIMNVYQREILLKCVRDNVQLALIKTRLLECLKYFTTQKGNSAFVVNIDVDPNY